MALIAMWGVVILGVTFALGFGFFGYLVGGIVLLGGLGGIAGMAVGGGSWSAPCPACGATVSGADFGNTMQRDQDKIFACPSCGVWAHGKTALEVVPDDYVHPTAVFTSKLPDTFHWPEGCPVCAGEVTGMTEVRGRNALGTAAIVGAGVGVQRVIVFQAPVCAVHKDGVEATRDPDQVLFRSMRYRRLFDEINSA